MIRVRCRSVVSLVLMLAGLWPHAANAAVIYVDPLAAPGGSGSSWVDAFQEVVDALGIVVPGDEIWVAAGTYLPDPSGLDRTSSFELHPDVGVYGGFAGVETSRDQRDPGVNVTILSGDLAGDDTSGGSNAENSLSVVDASSVGASAVLDGFTIERGNADSGISTGAGVFISSGSPQLSNLVIQDNEALSDGGGVWIFGGHPRFADVVFLNNTAGSSGVTGGDGGGAFVENGSITIVRGRFEGNTTTNGAGAGLGVRSSVATIVDSDFIGNSCISAPSPCAGGGVLTSSAPVSTSYGLLQNVRFVGNSAAVGGGLVAGRFVRVENALFSGNSATERGGGMLATLQVSIRNATFSGNSDTGALGGGAIVQVGFSEMSLSNSIMFGNTPNNYAADGNPSFTDISYTCIGGGFAGTGNIDCDPLFVDADGADNIVGTPDDDLRLSAGSPAIDAGHSGFWARHRGMCTGPCEPADLDGNPRLIDDPSATNTGVVADGLVVDMGGYEVQTGTPGFAPDADADGVADADDNCPLTANPGQGDNGSKNSSVADGVGDACQRGDIDGDGAYDASDVTVLRRDLADLPPGFDPDVP